MPVPGEPPLRVPAGFAEDQAKYEPGLQALVDGLEDAAKPEDVRRMLMRISGVGNNDADAMTETFTRLQALYEAGKNHIWPYTLCAI